MNSDDPIVVDLRRRSAEAGAELLAVVGDGRLLLVRSGTPTAVMCSPATVLHPVLAAGAEAITVLHTHPTSVPPSPADHGVTRRLRAACALLGVRFDGHYVVGPEQVWDCDGALAA